MASHTDHRQTSARPRSRAAVTASALTVNPDAILAFALQTALSVGLSLSLVLMSLLLTGGAGAPV